MGWQVHQKSQFNGQISRLRLWNMRGKLSKQENHGVAWFRPVSANFRWFHWENSAFLGRNYRLNSDHVYTLHILHVLHAPALV